MVALASIGPILAVLILGLLYQPDSAVYHTDAVPDAASSRSVALAFLRALPAYGKEVLVALLPITGLFALFQWKTRALKRRRLARIGVGLIYTFAGLVLFLTGVNVGFLPAGRQPGLVLGGASYRWSLIPLGALLGWFIVQAEPAVHVLSAQVESVTGRRREQIRHAPVFVRGYGHLHRPVHGQNPAAHPPILDSDPRLRGGLGAGLRGAGHVHRHRL